MNFVIIGPQGSGKGTQATLIAEKYNLTHIESGAILREKAKTDERIRDLLSVGAIVPDEETLSYINDFVVKKGSNYDNNIFDGYPRKVSQYYLLKKFVGDKGFKIDAVIYLNIPKSTSIERISSRRNCAVCGNVYNLVTNPPKNGNVCDCGGELTMREDDNPEAIEKRLNIFEENTKPILQLARDEGILIDIDGTKSITGVTEEIFSKLK